MARTTLFTISILALFLVSGIAIARYSGYCDGPDEKMNRLTQRIEKKLELDQQQRSQLGELREQTLIIMQQMRDERQRTAEATLALLDSPRFNREAARRLLDEKQRQLTSVADQLIDHFGDFSDTLRDDQRAKLQQMIQQHRRHRHYGFHSIQIDAARSDYPFVSD